MSEAFAWLTRVPAASWSRRFGLAALAGVGVGLAISQSLLYTAFGPIPYKLIPDVRLPLIFSIVFVFGIWASLGEAPRRAGYLWFILALLFVSAIDMVSIHWVIPVEAPLAGERMDPFRVAGMTGAVSAVLLLHADGHAVTLREALLVRGAPARDADAAHELLWRAALRRVGTLAGIMVSLAFVLWIADLAYGGARWGNTTLALIAGLAILGGVAYFAVQGLRERRRNA